MQHLSMSFLLALQQLLIHASSPQNVSMIKFQALLMSILFGVQLELKIQYYFQ
jgi:hypothetical protein